MAGILAVFGLGLCAVGGWIALSSGAIERAPTLAGGKLGDAIAVPEEPEPPPEEPKPSSATKEERVVEFSPPPPVPQIVPKPVETKPIAAEQSAKPAEPPPPPKRVVVVIADQSAVRNGTDIATTVAKGERLTVEQVQSPWILVSTPKRKDSTVWIRDDGVKKINQSTVEVKAATAAAKWPDGTKFPVTVGERFIISHTNPPWFLVTVPTASLTGWVNESEVKDAD